MKHLFLLVLCLLAIPLIIEAEEKKGNDGGLKWFDIDTRQFKVLAIGWCPKGKSHNIVHIYIKTEDSELLSISHGVQVLNKMIISDIFGILIKISKILSPKDEDTEIEETDYSLYKGVDDYDGIQVVWVSRRENGGTLCLRKGNKFAVLHLDYQLNLENDFLELEQKKYTLKLKKSEKKQDGKWQKYSGEWVDFQEVK